MKALWDDLPRGFYALPIYGGGGDEPIGYAVFEGVASR